MSSPFWEQGVIGPLRDLGREALASLSSFVGILVLILFGMVLGWIAKQIVYRLLRILHLDRLCNRLGVGLLVERSGLARSSSYLAGEIAQGLIILTALLAGLNAVGTPLTRKLMDRFFIYLPHFLAALLVLVVGALVSRFLGRSVLIAAVNAQFASARLLAGSTRFFIMTLTVVAALDELGIGRTSILITFAMFFGGVVAAAVVAFGLGGRDLAHRLLESQFPRREQAELQDALKRY